MESRISPYCPVEKQPTAGCFVILGINKNNKPVASTYTWNELNSNGLALLEKNPFWYKKTGKDKYVPIDFELFFKFMTGDHVRISRNLDSSKLPSIIKINMFSKAGRVFGKIFGDYDERY